jgi:lysocardiolipin and lysophospholipid acyltransferase
LCGTEYMQSLINDNFPFWLVIFPEGTTIHTEYVAKTKAYAEKYARSSFLFWRSNYVLC